MPPNASSDAAQPPVLFIDATDELGLGGINSTRVSFADVNADGRPDAIVRTADAYRIFLHTIDLARARVFWFAEVKGTTGLPKPQGGDCVVFADIDNDGIADAIVARSLDINNPKFAAPEDQPKETAWIKGNGDGTFALQFPIGSKKATTACIAVGDVDRDGRLDLYLGNWYTQYGVTNEAFTNDLLVQSHERTKAGFFNRVKLPEDDAKFDEEKDAAGRPTYGAIIINPAPTGNGAGEVGVLELNYGRRANLLWMRTGAAAEGAFEDVGVAAGIDGDAIRHGKYPDWLKEVAKTDPRFDRPDELPYRSHGNTFDASIGDVDNDGVFDIVLATITHAWAGESSDRSRVLFGSKTGAEGLRFATRANVSLDRVPQEPEPRPENYRPRWNQGDLFCELADLDHDGRLDLILSSGDYPDPAPYDNRLRIFHQQTDGSFKDVTGESGIDHVGSAQLSLADIDVDGDMDILVGQSYNRFTPEIIAATNTRQQSDGPRARVFLNQASELKPRSSITISFIGNPREKIAYDPLGLVARLTVTKPDGSKLVQMRHMTGIGGHGGKQNQFLVHFGLAGAARADKLEVMWPGTPSLVTTVENAAELSPNHYVMRATREK